MTSWEEMVLVDCQGGGAVDTALFQVYEGFVGGFEGVGVDVGADWDFGGQSKEFLDVLPGAVGNAANCKS